MNTYKKYRCHRCGFIYEEERGLPEEGIPPGTKWHEVPNSWRCADCGTKKSQFKMIEIV